LGERFSSWLAAGADLGTQTEYLYIGEGDANDCAVASGWEVTGVDQVPDEARCESEQLGGLAERHLV
jgi:hypothetical protein